MGTSSFLGGDFVNFEIRSRRVFVAETNEATNSGNCLEHEYYTLYSCSITNSTSKCKSLHASLKKSLFFATTTTTSHRKLGRAIQFRVFHGIVDGTIPNRGHFTWRVHKPTSYLTLELVTSPVKPAIDPAGTKHRKFIALHCSDYISNARTRERRGLYHLRTSNGGHFTGSFCE